ncbi:flavin reductase (DIM6/NTAB) family NADH-FMN oxidoreductase RutF [Tepidimonas ignava]|jgi:flavin reductase (DIM6/NTAB) family NADH-FMN oxidoreductase RutF|uniref:Flavin reductase (DIM6/NTAB) family NADH-FMN oxidoreductase RutF n=1 Tax=Tepidimonas ignava TaxID=114249 RepID=A0A4R3LKU2_9BURK|nr:flavin reductase family protein [Tepidimonas ignava]TCS98386.1 flavin reductase (DIM6/NTAB) family NADH-FMN oxidoreductase RutF [Tepidimonas ignava]TSE19548.1 p-hydroxyphenylacetate 3-hydroxylase, reductase component [Tepidimonas ignava]
MLHPSPERFRAALGRFATGVTIVTTRAADGAPVGLTVNSFNSVSLQPPLVLWSLDVRSRALAAFTHATHWAVHVLGAQQQALAERFARRDVDRWAGVPWTPNAEGVPLLPGCCAYLECRARSRYPEGDHVILVGEVLRCQHDDGAGALLYHGGRFFTAAP